MMLSPKEFRAKQAQLNSISIRHLFAVREKSLRVWTALTNFYEGEGTLIELRNELYHLTPVERKQVIELAERIDWSGAQTLQAEIISARLRIAE